MVWSEYQKQWYKDNIDREREKRKTYTRKYRVEQPDIRMWSASKSRAKLKGLEFDLERSDINIPEICPILKKPLIRNDLKYAPSLDRIDSSKGYTKGNVWVISRLANLMKNNANEEELKESANWVRTSQLS